MAFNSLSISMHMQGLIDFRRGVARLGMVEGF